MYLRQEVLFGETGDDESSVDTFQYELTDREALRRLVAEGIPIDIQDGRTPSQIYQFMVKIGAISTNAAIRPQ